MFLRLNGLRSFIKTGLLRASGIWRRKKDGTIVRHDDVFVNIRNIYRARRENSECIGTYICTGEKPFRGGKGSFHVEEGSRGEIRIWYIHPTKEVLED